MRAFYIVGGYVRDRLLGRETKDHDFVVVGSTPEELMAFGFQRVGSHFPVFLNKAGDEYALARTETKTGPGYTGFDVRFDPSVTLEEDLLRRDLTINAMARQVVDWNEQGHAILSDDIIDPYNGQADLRAGILRHVSVAFREDPVRVLRVARFKARYNFTVAPETQELMKQIVQAGEVDHLVAERVWQEMEGALMEKHPTQFFWELQSCGALAIMFPYLRSAVIHRGRALERAALLDHDLPIRFSLLCSLLTREQIDLFCFTYRVPNELKTFALATVAMVEFIGTETTAEQTLTLLSDLGAWQNPSVMVVAARAITMLASDTEMRRLDQLLRAHRAAFPVKFASLPAEQQATLKGKDIGLAIAAVRLKLIEQA